MKYVNRTIGAVVGLTALAATTLPPAMADGSLQRVKKQGYVVTALNQELPVAGIKSNGELAGIIPEVVEATLKRAGVGEFRGVLIDWGAMIPGLHARRYDLVSGGLYINPKRCKPVLFSEPIMCGAPIFVKLKSNPINVTSYAELAAHPTAKAAICPGCYEHMGAQQAGVSDDRFVFWEGNILNAVQLVRIGRADVMLASLATAKVALSKADDEADFEIVGPVPDLAAGCAAVAFNSEDRELRDAFDAGLKELQASGEFDAILKKWGHVPELPRAASRKALCEGVPN